MFSKTVLALSVVIFIVQVTSNPLHSRSNEPLQLVSIITLEEPCVRQGGICLPISECNPKNLVDSQIRGFLCPKQRHLDVECCYS